MLFDPSASVSASASVPKLPVAFAPSLPSPCPPPVRRLRAAAAATETASWYRMRRDEEELGGVVAAMVDFLGRGVWIGPVDGVRVGVVTAAAAVGVG